MSAASGQTRPLALSGKRYWLIGASDGIGAELAVRMSEEGAHIALSARRLEKLEDVRERMQGTDHKLIRLDVTKLTELQAGYEQILESWPVLDGVIYNCGDYEPMVAQRLVLERVENILDVNLRGAFRVLSLVLPKFLKLNAGHVVLVGSVAGYRGLPASIGYGASKSALIHLAENLRVDLCDTNIRVQCVNPGFVRTALTAKNSFAMPFLLSPVDAARRICRGFASERFEIHFPKRLSLLLKAIALLPAPLHLRIVKQFRPRS